MEPDRRSVILQDTSQGCPMFRRGGNVEYVVMQKSLPIENNVTNQRARTSSEVHSPTPLYSSVLHEENIFIPRARAAHRDGRCEPIPPLQLVFPEEEAFTFAQGRKAFLLDEDDGRSSGNNFNHSPRKNLFRRNSFYRQITGSPIETSFDRGFDCINESTQQNSASELSFFNLLDSTSPIVGTSDRNRTAREDRNPNSITTDNSVREQKDSYQALELPLVIQPSMNSSARTATLFQSTSNSTYERCSQQDDNKIPNPISRMDKSTTERPLIQYTCYDSDIQQAPGEEESEDVAQVSLNIKGHVVELSVQPLTFNIIKTIIERNTRCPKLMNTIIHELSSLKALQYVMFSPNGNYVIQDLIPKLDDTQLFNIATIVVSGSRDFIAFSGNKYATHCIQVLLKQIGKAKECIKKQEIVSTVVSIVKSNMKIFTCNKIPHNVITKMLMIFDETRLSPLYNYIIRHVYALATNQTGCIVVKKAITFADKFKKQLIAGTIKNIEPLALNKFGNYVVQVCIDECAKDKGLKAQFIREMSDRLSPDLYKYCIDKHASNIIEGLLNTASGELRRTLIDKILSSENLQDIVKDKFGNYVISEVYKLGTTEDRSLIAGLQKAAHDQDRPAEREDKK